MTELAEMSLVVTGVGLLVGFMMAATACTVFLKHQTCGAGGGVLSILGTVLIGMSVWSNISVSVGPEGGTLLSTALIVILACASLAPSSLFRAGRLTQPEQADADGWPQDRDQRERQIAGSLGLGLVALSTAVVLIPAELLVF
jgi:hypothetical protein